MQLNLKQEGKIKGVLLLFHSREWERGERGGQKQKGFFLGRSRGNRPARRLLNCARDTRRRVSGAGRGGACLSGAVLCRRRRGVVGVSAVSSLRCWRRWTATSPSFALSLSIHPLLAPCPRRGHRHKWPLSTETKHNGPSRIVSVPACAGHVAPPSEPRREGPGDPGDDIICWGSGLSFAGAPPPHAPIRSSASTLRLVGVFGLGVGVGGAGVYA